MLFRMKAELFFPFGIETIIITSRAARAQSIRRLYNRKKSIFLGFPSLFIYLFALMQMNNDMWASAAADAV